MTWHVVLIIEPRPHIPLQETTTQGIFLLILATLLFAIQDAITKHLTYSVPVAQLMFVRYACFAVFALVYVSRKTRVATALVSHWPKLQLLRGLLIVAETALFAYCLKYLGIAEMHTLFACFPLLITILSVPILGEQIGWRRGLAIALGFLGTVIIIQPGSGIFSPYALIALLCALMFALYNIITRKVSRKDSFETSLLYFGLIGFAVTLLVVPFFWRALDGTESAWLLAISIVSICSHLLLIKSLELAPAVVLQPFNYFILVWAMLIGYSFYGEVLDITTLSGAALVAASGIYIARRELSLARSHRRHLRKAMYPPES